MVGSKNSGCCTQKPASVELPRLDARRKEETEHHRIAAAGTPDNKKATEKVASEQSVRPASDPDAPFLQGTFSLATAAV